MTCTAFWHHHIVKVEVPHLGEVRPGQRWRARWKPSAESSEWLLRLLADGRVCARRGCGCTGTAGALPAPAVPSEPPPGSCTAQICDSKSHNLNLNLLRETIQNKSVCREVCHTAKLNLLALTVLRQEPMQGWLHSLCVMEGITDSNPRVAGTFEHLRR